MAASAKDDFSATAFTVDSMVADEQKQYEDMAKMSGEERKARAEEKARADRDREYRKINTAQAKAQIEVSTLAQKEAIKRQGESDEIKKKPILTKINRYMDTFTFLKSTIPKLPAKCSLQEAEEVLKLIREEMGSKLSIVSLHKYLEMILAQIQMVWKDGSGAPKWVPPPLRLDLSNMTAYYRAGMFAEDLEPLIAEIDIEYPWLGRQGLLSRVGGAMFDVAQKTHAENVKGAMAGPAKAVDLKSL